MQSSDREGEKTALYALLILFPPLFDEWRSIFFFRKIFRGRHQLLTLCDKDARPRSCFPHFRRNIFPGGKIVVLLARDRTRARAGSFNQSLCSLGRFSLYAREMGENMYSLTRTTTDDILHFTHNQFIKFSLLLLPVYDHKRGVFNSRLFGPCYVYTRLQTAFGLTQQHNMVT